MTTTALRIMRNTAWFTFGSVGQKLFSFLHFTVIAMAIGVAGTGRYFFALTFIALFAMAADWGISPVITREVARNRAAGLGLFRSALRCKLVTISVTVLVIGSVVVLAGYTHDVQRAIAVATLTMAIDSIHLVCYAVLRGIQRVHYEAIGTIVSQAMVTILGIGTLVVLAGLRFGDSTFLSTAHPIDTVWLLAPFAVASVVNVGIAVIGLVREGVLRDLHTTVRGSWRLLIRTSTPFALTAILARVYTYSDTFLLSLLASGLAVGYYSTPFKIAFAFQFIPLALIGALYPAMSEAAVRDRPRLGEMFTASVRALLLIAMPIAFGIAVLAYRILVTIYGIDFAPSTVPLIILAAAVPLTFVNFPAGYLLNAIDRQSTNTVLVAIATAANITANLLFIPRWGATGAAAAALSATALLTIMNVAIVHHTVRFSAHTIVDAFLRTLAACLVMSTVVLLAASLPLGIVVTLGGLAYAVAAVLVRAVRRADFALVQDALRHRASITPETTST
ncbi:MAG: flippase [bacterium]|nr:flippase [bacterium]